VVPGDAVSSVPYLDQEEAAASGGDVPQIIFPDDFQRRTVFVNSPNFELRLF
jgi:hypothetical protein